GPSARSRHRHDCHPSCFPIPGSEYLPCVTTNSYQNRPFVSPGVPSIVVFDVGKTPDCLTLELSPLFKPSVPKLPFSDQLSLQFRLKSRRGSMIRSKISKIPQNPAISLHLVPWSSPLHSEQD